MHRQFISESAASKRSGLHSVSKSKERGRMQKSCFATLYERRKEKESWQSIENLEEHLHREKHC